MNRVMLLNQLAEFTKDAVAALRLPVREQKADERPPSDRPAAVYQMRLPDSTAAKKFTPYILHQVITGADRQPSGEHPRASAQIRSIFCVYSADEQEGGLLLLNLMERVRMALLEQVVIGKQFELDLQSGVETLIYPDDTAPYFAGEMSTMWKLPAVERKGHYGKESIRCSSGFAGRAAGNAANSFGTVR